MIHGTAVCQPKEIDALGQAMMDSLKFAIAPIYVDEQAGVLAALVSDVIASPGGFTFTPASVNKMAVAGRLEGSNFRVRGSMRLIAQGANIPLDTFQLSGRIVPGPSIENANGYLVTSVSRLPEFAELVRVMRLADPRDDIVGFTTVSASPFVGDSLRPGLEATLERRDDRVVTTSLTPGLSASDHWIDMVFLDPNRAEIVGQGEAELQSDGGGALTGVRAVIPHGARDAETVVILTVDLGVVATIRIHPAPTVPALH